MASMPLLPYLRLLPRHCNSTVSSFLSRRGRYSQKVSVSKCIPRCAPRSPRVSLGAESVPRVREPSVPRICPGRSPPPGGRRSHPGHPARRRPHPVALRDGIRRLTNVNQPTNNLSNISQQEQCTNDRSPMYTYILM